MKIVSLVPSWTELVYYLGAGSNLIGRTKFCIHPASVRETLQIGGTKNVRVDQVLALHPDLIIANKEENVKSQVERLQNDVETIVTDIPNFESALQGIVDIGKAIGTLDKANECVNRIVNSFAKLNGSHVKLRVCYLIWQKPFMTVGGDTFIHSMLSKAGFDNVFSKLNRYPTTSLDEILFKKPDLIFLSTEPYPFKKGHLRDIQKELKTPVMLVDGEHFSWYGSHMIQAAAYFEALQMEAYRILK